MPIHTVKLENGLTGYQWGKSGKVYRTKLLALKQMRAIFANGYKGHSKKANISENIMSGLYSTVYTMVKRALAKTVATTGALDHRYIGLVNNMDVGFNAPKGYTPWGHWKSGNRSIPWDKWLPMWKKNNPTLNPNRIPVGSYIYSNKLD